MKQRFNQFFFAALFAVLCAGNAVHADDMQGDDAEGAGRAAGFKGLEVLGMNADAEAKRFKGSSQFYKSLDEGAAAIAPAPFSLACTAAFENVIGAARTLCNGVDAQSDPGLIDIAKQRLIDSGLFKVGDFDGVTISWCAGGFTGNGITPSRDEIMLNADLQEDTLKTATALAHEMQHIAQFRRMGSGIYKCEYARYYSRCEGCQDGNHPLESESYRFEDHAHNTLSGNTRFGNSAGVSRNVSLADSSLPVLPSSVPGDLERMDCKDCFSYLRSPDSSRNKSGKRFFEALRNTRLSLDAERKARVTCSYDSKPMARAVESCMDDMAVIYTEIIERVVGDYAMGKRNALNDYWQSGKQDMTNACNILRATSDSVEIGKERSERCVASTKSAVREMVSFASQKYSK